MNLSILEAVFVTSWFWLFICAIVSLFSYVNGLDHTNDHFNWSTGFSNGWHKGWNHGAECILELVEKHDLATIRKAFENLKKQEENPPE
mgnify:FL=1